MKKILSILIIILALIVSEYFLLSELFSERRGSIILLSVIIFAISAFLIIRLWKKNIEKLRS